MRLHLLPEEPDFGPWQVVALRSFVASLRVRLPDAADRTGVVAIDGRSAGGKSTLAAAVGRAVPEAVVVHTDDVAWHHSFFDWAELLRSGVLAPARAGREVRFRPPAWRRRDRPGSIEVPAGCAVLIVEGVGAARTELMPLIDAVVWVQSDAARAEVRGIARDGGDEKATAFWREWTAAEEPFLAQQRPWQRAHAVVCGTPDIAADPETQVVVSMRHEARRAESAAAGA